MAIVMPLALLLPRLRLPCLRFGRSTVLFFFGKGKTLLSPQGTRVDSYIDGEHLLAGEAPTAENGRVAITGQTLSNEDVVALHRAGFGEELIIAKINGSRRRLT